MGKSTMLSQDLRRVIYIGNNPQLVEKTKKYGYGIARWVGDLLEVWYPDQSISYVNPEDVAADFHRPAPRAHLAPDYHEPLPLPPDRLIKWAENQGVGYLMEHRPEGVTEEDALAIYLWWQTTLAAAKAAPPSRALMSQLWLDARQTARRILEAVTNLTQPEPKRKRRNKRER